MQASLPDLLVRWYVVQSMLIGLSHLLVLPGQFKRVTYLLVKLCSHLSQPLLLGCTRHYSLKESQGPLEIRESLGICIDLACYFTGAPVVGDCLLEETGMLVMGRKLPADRIQVAGMQRFERLGCPTVEEASSCGT